MSNRIIVLASLFIHPGREVEFRQFETEAARIMKKYGGQIEHVIRPTASGSGGTLPYEIHVVTFPSREQFEAYRTDPDLTTFAALRQIAISRTDVIMGEEGEPYL
jgi:uncharacterized protein (DUF1330 family)